MNRSITQYLQYTFAALLALGLAAGVASAQFENGSFESGFNGWIAQDMATPYYPLNVGGAGIGAAGTFVTQPTHGSLVAYNGFDGGGPDMISIAQDVMVPKSGSLLLFDYGGAWSISSYASQDREFRVLVEPNGGGKALRSFDILTAARGTYNSNTGLIAAAVDLDEFRGQMVRVNFTWWVPEYFTGPGFCQLDHVRFTSKKVQARDMLSLRVKLNFQQEEKDLLKLSMMVPVQPGFTPGGKKASITVGDLTKDFILDSKGKGVLNANVLRVRADKHDETLQRLTLSCKKGSFAAELAGHGLGNYDTVKGGQTASVPISVNMDGMTTNRWMTVVYNATKTKRGVARGKTPPQLRRFRLNVDLNFASADKDKVILQGWVQAGPGFLPEGAALDIDVGPLSKSFSLDKSGRATVGAESVLLRRDKRDPSLYLLTLKCLKGDFADAFAQVGMHNETVPKPGTRVSLPVIITLPNGGGLKSQILPDVSYWARFDKQGKAVCQF